MLTQAKVLADFAKDDVQALDLAKDNKILDLINTVERFTQSLLSNQDLLYLDVAKLAVQCSEKSEQEMVWAFLTYQLGKDIQNPQARRWLDLVYEARKMWLANVSFQNAMEYMVIIMTEVIGIKFEETGTIEYVVPDRNYAKDDFVVVLDKKDKRLAQVVVENTNFPEVSLPTDLNRVEGLAGEKDFARYDENLLKAEKSMGVVADLIAQNQLEMKVVDILFPLNCSYVLISFVAEKRVDFRQLLKDLASYFKTRIELRQISSREESKIYGGLGPCGRHFVVLVFG